jgi:hypothetical protein
VKRFRKSYALRHNFSRSNGADVKTRPPFRSFFVFFCFLSIPAILGAQSKPNSHEETGWPTYSNDPGGTRYSPAKQINRDNVTQLKVAWTFRTGALPHDDELDYKAAFEATPILIDGNLLLSTPYDHVISLTCGTIKRRRSCFAEWPGSIGTAT